MYVCMYLYIELKYLYCVLICNKKKKTEMTIRYKQIISCYSRYKNNICTWSLKCIYRIIQVYIPSSCAVFVTVPKSFIIRYGAVNIKLIKANTGHGD